MDRFIPRRPAAPLGPPTTDPVATSVCSALGVDERIRYDRRLRRSSASVVVMIQDSAHLVATAIQLALAPVFLLTGIAGLLNVISGRLSRIVDRWRALSEGRSASMPAEAVALELHILERRRRWTSVAMAACTVAALLVCMVIAALFVEALLAAHLNGLIGALFTGAMLALVIGLCFFMREVHLGTTNRMRTPRER